MRKKPSNAKRHPMREIRTARNPGARRKSSAVRKIRTARNRRGAQSRNRAAHKREHGNPARKSAGCAGGRLFKTADRGGRVKRTRIRCDGDAEIWREIRRSAKRQRTKPQRGALSQDDAKGRPMRKVIQCEKSGQHEPRRKAKIGAARKIQTARNRRSTQSRNRAAR